MSNLSLFTSEKNEAPRELSLPNSEILYYPSFMAATYASEVFDTLLDQTEWQQDDIKIFGKTFPQPRLTALYGDDNKSYRYSNITMFPKKMTPLLKEIKTKVEAVTGIQFTSVLLNLYRDGNDSNGWHSDNEKELGVNPVIASVSLGAVRNFKLKHRQQKELKHQLFLAHGSLLVMRGETQHHWLHQLPKSKKITTPRINLTFRVLK